MQEQQNGSKNYLKSFAFIQKILKRDLNYLSELGSDIDVIVVEGEMVDFPEARDFAYADINDDPYIITVSPRLKLQKPTRIIAILRHELGHCLLSENPDHSEQEADDIVETLFGHRIYYDSENIQTIIPANWPRPLEIHQ